MDVGFEHGSTIGFDIEKNPFGKGAECLAYMFNEIGSDNLRKGKAMVAKETKFVSNEDREIRFHEIFCRTQGKSNELAKNFNREVQRTPVFRPLESYMKTPDIHFLDCHVYEYLAPDGTVCGLLVEDYLKGKFTKFNSNNGYVKKNQGDAQRIGLEIGEVYLSDLFQAFSTESTFIRIKTYSFVIYKESSTTRAFIQGLN